MTDPTLSPIALLSSAIRRERERAGLSVTELAKRASVAKSTLSQLESGTGNPSLETLWALALALDVPVSRLISQPSQHVQVIRANEGAAAESEQANYAATLLAACPAGAPRDIYRVKVLPGEPRISRAHGPGTLEHVIICSGTARVGPVGRAVEVTVGDYVRYSADGPHGFEAVGGEVVAVMVIEQP